MNPRNKEEKKQCVKQERILKSNSQAISLMTHHNQQNEATIIIIKVSDIYIYYIC